MCNVRIPFLCAVCLAVWCAMPCGAEAQPSLVTGFSVVPPGPVSTHGAVELRAGLRNEGSVVIPVEVEFLLVTGESEQRLATEKIELEPQASALVSRWPPGPYPAGRHMLRCRIVEAANVRSYEYPFDVRDAATPALARIGGVWIEPLAAIRPPGESAGEVRSQVAREVQAMKDFGVSLLILAYVEYQGKFFYPSSLRFFDRDLQAEVKGAPDEFDYVGAVLDAADAGGLHVMLGLGRSGDSLLLWEFEHADWVARKDAALRTARAVAEELQHAYGHHRSFYGWYLTHEANDLAKAAAYYDPIADFCHEFAPEKPVMIAPSGTPIASAEILAAGHADIFAWQDAAGAGYVPYTYTYDPEERLAMLDEVFQRYSQWHINSKKHCWSDLEVWEMDGGQGYAGAFPAAPERVRRQIALEAPHVQWITAYAWHGYLQPLPSQSPEHQERARQLGELLVSP